MHRCHGERLLSRVAFSFSEGQNYSTKNQSIYGFGFITGFAFRLTREALCAVWFDSIAGCPP
jgi:hypothetical protein